MTDVWIYHEGLDRYSQVPETAVGVHAMSGWVQQDPPPESDDEAETGQDEAEPEEIEAAQPTQEGDEE